MSAEGTPRTWTLSEREPRLGATLASTEVGGIRVKPEHECSFSDEILTQVIELEPVLDLLARYAGSTNPCVTYETSEATQALLAAHGRLKGAKGE